MSLLYFNDKSAANFYTSTNLIASASLVTPLKLSHCFI